jgi:hypothetical protein
VKVVLGWFARVGASNARVFHCNRSIEGSITALALSPPQLDELTAILWRASPRVGINSKELKRDIEDLLSAVGITNDGSQRALDFEKAAEEESSHAELVQQFLKIASSDDPLDPQICHGLALAELNAAARRKWTSRRYRRLINRPHMLLGITSDFLTESERSDIQQFARELAGYHQAQIKRQRPHKGEQDALLHGLADIFLRHTGSSKHPYELPHSLRSYFMLFCHAVLQPFFHLTEASPKALSRRWQDLKNQQYAPPKDPRFAGSPDEA